MNMQIYKHSKKRGDDCESPNIDCINTAEFEVKIDNETILLCERCLRKLQNKNHGYNS